MHAASIIVAEVAVGSEPRVRRSSVEDSRKIRFKITYLYRVMHNLPEITTQFACEANGGVHKVWHPEDAQAFGSEKSLDSLAKCAVGGTSNCQCLNIMLGGVRVTFQDVVVEVQSQSNK